VSLDTYDDLKTAVGDWLDRDDLMQHVDDFIDIAEARHRDEVRFREILVSDTLAFDDGDRTEALPADFAQIKYMRLINPSTGAARRFLWPLVQLTEDAFVEKSSNCEGPPKYFTINNLIEFDTEAEQDYTIDILYYKTMTALASGNQSNELLVRAPDVYLYGALSASAPFLMNDERIATWEGLYREARDRVNLSERTNKLSGPQVARVSGV